MLQSHIPLPYLGYIQYNISAQIMFIVLLTRAASRGVTGLYP